MRRADQCLCFCYRMVQFLFLLNQKFEASTKPAFVTVQVGLCQAWSETPTVFSRVMAHLLFVLILAQR